MDISKHEGNVAAAGAMNGTVWLFVATLSTVCHRAWSVAAVLRAVCDRVTNCGTPKGSTSEKKQPSQSATKTRDYILYVPLVYHARAPVRDPKGMPSVVVILAIMDVSTGHSTQLFHI